MTHNDLHDLQTAINTIESVFERMDERGEVTPHGRKVLNESLSKLRALYFNHRLGAAASGI